MTMLPPTTATCGRPADPDPYLARLGVDPDRVAPDLETLARLQRAHVTTVPFETLSVTGDPHGDRDGDGPSVAVADSYRKVVDHRRGGYCFELNGAFGWLLDVLGFDAERRAARVVGDDGTARPPANHCTTVVTLDRPYVVDVGMGVPTMRQPTPVDGESSEDDLGITWRVVESDRPDADYATQYRLPDDDEWSVRFVFTDRPREMDYFRATNDYLSTAPESPFTGDPVATIATDEGHLKLLPDTLIRYGSTDREERAVDPAEYHRLLETEFGIRFREEEAR